MDSSVFEVTHRVKQLYPLKYMDSIFTMNFPSPHHFVGYSIRYEGSSIPPAVVCRFNLAEAPFFGGVDTRAIRLLPEPF